MTRIKEPAMPPRIQLSRRKGWRKPAGAVVVSRPTKWGNPFPANLYGGDKAMAVARFREYLTEDSGGRAMASAARRHLRGKALCCWCKPGDACHADVLIEIANRSQP